jgi:hypothetical protein
MGGPGDLSSITGVLELWSGKDMANQECRFMECENVGAVTGDGVCKRCEGIVAAVRDGIERRRLPKVPVREVRGPRTTAFRFERGGMPCAACDQQIDGDHFAYPDYPDPDRKRDLHMHFLCHEIWEEEATVAD